MERTIYDNVVFSPERIIFEASPILGDGLVKKNTDAYLLEGETDYLDLSKIPIITSELDREYRRLVADAKKHNENDPYVVESKGIFKEHVRAKVRGGQYKNRKEYDMLNEDEIVEKE